MWIFGILLCLAGIGLTYTARRKKKRLESLESTHTATVSFLSDLSAALSDDSGGPGSLVYKARLSGRTHSDTPLTSALDKTPCVYHEHSVVREYEEDRRASDGSVDTSRHTDTLESDRQMISFAVDDGSGQILVDPREAKITGSKTLSRYEPHSDRFDGSFELGSRKISFDRFSGRGRRTLGYRIVEKTIGVGQEVFLTGEVTDKEGILKLGKPSDKSPFIISTESEEQVIGSARSSAKWFGIWGIVLLAAGVLMVVFGV